jgi:hypothetical protein
MPLPAADPDEAMPKDLQTLATYMRQRYTEAGEWWGADGHTTAPENELPKDMLEDMKPPAPPAEASAHE